jgi:hypothetical protein
MSVGEPPPGPESEGGAPGKRRAPNFAKTGKKSIRPSQIVKLARLRERYWRGDSSAKEEILRILRRCI